MNRVFVGLRAVAAHHGLFIHLNFLPHKLSSRHLTGPEHVTHNTPLYTSNTPHDVGSVPQGLRQP